MTTMTSAKAPDRAWLTARVFQRRRQKAAYGNRVLPDRAAWADGAWSALKSFRQPGARVHRHPIDAESLLLLGALPSFTPQRCSRDEKARTMSMTCQMVSSGAPFEQIYEYSCAVRVGALVHVPRCK
jgi:hypothetical protein